ncbi:MAG: FAD-binding protein [Deltaproteobacteria bacterium]|nr:FAD-binding protein [Deltaproteobacteria bacterium]
MTAWLEYLHENRSFQEWPYPVRYGEENVVDIDVLFIGGGIAGCHGAISAAKRGARVAVTDKGPVIRSGAGGAGVDHWHLACTNPASRITPEEMVDVLKSSFGDYGYGEFGNGIAAFISCKESYDALLDIEGMGIKVRDVDDEFVGAPFRDEETKLLFAYDYDNRFCIRVQAAKVKPALYRELKRLEIGIYDHIVMTSLLTEDGRPGSRVTGAVGIHRLTGEFYIFRARATVLSLSRPSDIWIFDTESKGAGYMPEPNNTCEGLDMMWRAGVELTMMESSGTRMQTGGFSNIPYSTGNSHNTWFACTLVDAGGKEIPWVDRNGKVLKSVEERYHPAPGQRAFIYDGPRLIPDLPQRIAEGEFKLPLFADLPGMPEHERRVIWGLMIGNEGKTLVPIYHNFQKWGFDPDKDMLQATVQPPDLYTWGAWWKRYGPRQYRGLSGGGPVFDWDLKTNLPGLYAAGNSLACGSNHSGSATTGRYAGRKAAAYASMAGDPVIDRNQVENEKLRIYAPVRRNKGMGWKELKSGIARIMQDYCGETKNDDTLRTGLKWLDSVRSSEIETACAGNPHELGRTMEAMAQLNVSEVIIHACLARKASSGPLGFKRLDYPQMDPPEWNKFLTIRQEMGEIKTGELPFDFWLLPPNSTSYEENYQRHGDL